MTLRVSGKNLDIGDALRTQIEERVAALFAKYVEGATYSGHVTMTRDGARFRADCIFHLSSGRMLEASGAAHDAHASFNEAADRLEARLRRHKGRLKNRSGGHAGDLGRGGIEMVAKIFESPGDDVEEGAFHPVVVAEMTKAVHSLSVGDAVIELDLTGKPLLLFRHAGHGRMNVVYRREDGTIGWIDPPQSVSAGAA